MDSQNTLILCDVFIESIIGLDEVSFERFAAKSNPGIAPADAVNHVLKWIRRRTVRRTEYSGPATPDSRIRRTGLAWSWVEERIMKFAFSGKDSETPKGVEVTEEYVANLLQRTIDEVKEKRRTKNGIIGFDLGI